MNVRIFFHRQTFYAAILCPVLAFSMSRVDFSQPTLFKASEYQLSAPFFKFISAGFWPATADVLWMQTLQRVGSGMQKAEVISELSNLYRLITELDPNFYEIYDQAAVMLGYYFEEAGPALEIIDRGIHIYENGNPPQKFWSHPYSLYVYRAYINSFVSNDWSKAKIDYLRAADVPGAPLYLKTMKTWLVNEGSEKQLAQRVLKMLVSNSTNPIVKAKYLEKLKMYE